MGSRRRGGWPAGLLGMLGLVAGVELAAARAVPGWAHTIVLDWRATGRDVARAAREADVLCFGSSLSKFGVHPRVIEAETGLKGFNLALLNGPPPASYFLLRRALDAGAKPKAVVVDFGVERLEKDPLSPAFNYPWAELLTPAEAFDLARRTGDLGFFGRMVAARLPTVRGRHEIRSAVVLKLQGFAGRLDQVNAAFGSKPAYLRNRRRNRGAVANAPKPGYPGPARPDSVPDRRAEWRCDPVTAGYVRAFLDLTHERGVPVFWLYPPVTPAHQDEFDRSGLTEVHHRLATALAVQYPHVTLVDAERSGYPTSRFVDHVHLDRDGAEALSRGLGAVVAGRVGPSGARVVSLPAYRPGASGLLEDLGQSDLALKAGASVRR